MSDLDQMLQEQVRHHTPTALLDFATVRADAVRRRRRRRTTAYVIGSAVLAGSAVTAAALLDGDGDGGGQITAGPSSSPSSSPASGVTRTGELRSDSDTVASCAFSYPDTLGERGFAFDGTVTAIEDETTTFRVERWYAGGEGDSVAVPLRPTEAQFEVESVPVYAPSYEIGTRMLVSGEEDQGTTFVWQCGFTRYWDAATAADWEVAFGG